MSRKKENIVFVILLIFTASILYYLPIAKPIFFIGTLYFFYKSKNNYFWLAYYFTVVYDVGGFFMHLTEDVIKFGAIELSLLLIYSFVSFYKLRNDKSPPLFFVKNNLNIWLGYMFFLLFVGYFIIGNDGGGKTGFRYPFLIVTVLPIITVLYTTYKMIPNEKALLSFSRLLFITIIINVIGQVIYLYLGNPVYSYFEESAGINNFSGRSDLDFRDKLIRPVIGVISCLIALFLSMYLILKESTYFKQKYLTFILLLSGVSIFITATRGWILAVVFFLLFSLLVLKVENKFRVIKVITIAIVAYLFLYSLNDSVRIQTNLVVERLSTLEDLAKGDLTARGTNSRLTDRSAAVMRVFYKRPIFGSGFSLEGLETNDPHVGNQNLLMSGGIIGYLIILAFWINIIRTCFLSHRFNMNQKGYKGETLIIIPFLFSLLIIHSSSMSVFRYTGYLKHANVIFGLALIIAIMNQIIYNYTSKRIKNG